MGKRKIKKVGVYCDTSTTWHPGCDNSESDESSELDSTEQRRLDEYKKQAMERMKGSNEDIQSDVVSVEDEGAEMLSMENDFNSNVPGLLDEQLTSDLHEPQPAKKKASPTSNSRIRWLETKLKDVDTF